MKNFLAICGLLCHVYAGANAQHKRFYTFQYNPGVNQKSISGTVTKISTSMLSNQKLTWLYLGDTVIHVWDKDLKREMEVGRLYTFSGIQRLTGC